MRKKRGQSILEYTLLIAAVVLAVVYGANKIISVRAKTTMDDSGLLLDKAAEELRTATGIDAP